MYQKMLTTLVGEVRRIGDLCRMSNQISYKLLGAELAPYLQMLGEAADTVRDKEVSDFPIFVVHQHEVAVGIPLVKHDEVKTNWSVNASSLEEFVSKRLIQEDKMGDFQRVYKDPEVYLCMFVLSELGANFIWLPRKPEAA